VSLFHLSSELIEEVGTDEAVFLDGLSRMFHHKSSNEMRGADGRVWVWTVDRRLLDTLFPFWSEKVLRRIRASLLARGVLIQGSAEVGRSSADGANPPAAALWFAFADESHWFERLNISRSRKPIRPNGQVNSPKRANQMAQTGESPLPLETPDLTPDQPRDQSRGPATPGPAPEPAGTITLLEAEPLKPSLSKAKPGPTAGTQVWTAYAEAYERRWGVRLERDASSSSICAALARKWGEDAPAVAAFYPFHPRPDFVKAQHPLEFLASPYGKNAVYGDWKRGRIETTQAALQAEKKVERVSQVQRVVESLRRDDERRAQALEDQPGVKP
jgi:hypothetical protein